MKTFLVLTLFLVLNLKSFSQIVNIESRRVTNDTTEWSGESGVDFLVIKEVNTIYAANGNVQVQFKKDKSLLLFLTEFGFIKANEEKFQNSGFQHIRFNYKVTPELLRWEAFGQAQYNSVRDIKLRCLLGSGPRFKIYDSKQFRLYAAALYMFEYEERNSERFIERTHRLSSYVSYGISLGKMELSSTVYYQPAFKDPNDYRISCQADLEFEISRGFSFVTKYKLLYDTAPPPGIPTTSYLLSNGLKLEL